MTSLSIKMLVSAVGLAVVLASPADAAKARKHRKHVTFHTAPVMVNVRYRGTNLFPAGPVMFNGGEYLGDDPDPFIRSQLLRDLGAHFGGND